MSKLIKIISKYAKNNPDNKSITYRINDTYESITYKELNNKINTLSSYLTKYKNKNIAIIGNNKLEYLVSLLSVIGNIGNAFLIDKELKEEDINILFKQVKPSLIILDDELTLKFKEYEILKFSKITEILKDNIVYKPDLKFSGSLILHTSGTTGTPKCIKLTESNYFGVIPELNDKWKVVSSESCLLIIPLYHIYALTSLFHGLYAGIENILEYDYKRLNNVLKETKPALFMGVPLMYNKIKEQTEKVGGKKLKIAINISNILLKLHIDIRKKLFKEIHAYFGGNYVFGCSAGSLLPYKTNKFFNDVGLPVYNVYGMTETSGPMAINYKDNNDYNSVGRILNINKIKIVNADSNGVGEIIVKGPNIFNGYIKLKKDNSLIGNYFNTGDIGYIKNNYLYVIGRKKNILIGDNGKNVSPEELNRKILKYKNIHDCNVIMENNKLVAIINTDLTEDEIDNIIKKVNNTLPNYKKISKFIITDKKIK